MSSAQAFAEKIESRATTIVEISGNCNSITMLLDGRCFWTLWDSGKVECYDLEAKCPEWTAEDCGQPHACAYVEGDPPRLWVTDPGRDRILWLDTGTGEITHWLPSEDYLHSCTFDGKALKQPRGLTVWQAVARVPEPVEAPAAAAEGEGPPQAPAPAAGTAEAQATAEDPAEAQATAASAEPAEVPCEVWVADSGNHRVVGLNPENGKAFQTMGEGLLDTPQDVEAMDPSRLAVVCRKGGHVFSPKGELLLRFNWHLMIPSAVTFDARGSEGLLLTADEYTPRICMFNATTGEHVLTLPSTGLCEGTFAYKGLAMYKAEDGTYSLLVADSMHQRLGAMKAPTPPPPVTERPPEEAAAAEEAPEGKKKKKKFTWKKER